MAVNWPNFERDFDSDMRAKDERLVAREKDCPLWGVQKPECDGMDCNPQASDSNNDESVKLLTNYLVKICGIEILPTNIGHLRGSYSASIKPDGNKHHEEGQPARGYDSNKTMDRKEAEKSNLFTMFWRRFPNWDKVMFMTSSIILIRLFINASVQYCYDKYNFQTINYQNIGWISGVDPKERLRSAQEKMEYYLKILTKLGAPYRNFNFLAESVIDYILVASAILYFLPRFIYKNKKTNNFGSIRLFLDEKDDKSTFDQIMAQESNNFLASHRNFIRCAIQSEVLRSNSKLEIDERKITFIDRMDETDETEGNDLHGNVCRSIRNYRLMNLMLNRMIREGRLTPFNRSKSWIVFISFIHKLCSLSFIVIVNISVFIVLIVLPGFTDYGGVVLETEPTDCLMIAEALTISFIYISCVAFFFSSILTNALDQLFALNKLRDAIDECERIGTIRFFHLLDKKVLDTGNDLLNLSTSDIFLLDSGIGNKLDDEELRVHSIKMNENILYVLMHHKIFVAQLKPLLRTIGPMASGVFSVVAIVPIILRIHLPYYSYYSRNCMLAFCFISFLWADMCFIPLCYFHSRIVDLHKALFNLLAHAILVQRKTDSLYDQHIIWTLRKQLKQLDWQMGEFAVKFGLKFTYSTLLQLHFWTGLVMTSSIMYTSDLALGGGFDRDPLGIL